jgi:hypothetical protein
MSEEIQEIDGGWHRSFLPAYSPPGDQRKQPAGAAGKVECPRLFQLEPCVRT